MRRRQMTDHEKLAEYAESFFAKMKNTEFPTVREAARALKWTQKRVQEAVEGDPEGRLFLTTYLTHPMRPLGDHFVERA